MTSLFSNEPQERAAELDQRIVDLLYGTRAGLFGEHLNAAERAVLKALRFHTSSANPIPLRILMRKADLTERAVKDCIRTLRLNFRLPIGASRNCEAGGYYFFLTNEDRVAFRTGYLRQIRAELEVLRAVDSQEAVLEMLGQLRAELEVQS